MLRINVRHCTRGHSDDSYTFVLSYYYFGRNDFSADRNIYTTPNKKKRKSHFPTEFVDSIATRWRLMLTVRVRKRTCLYGGTRLTRAFNVSGHVVGCGDDRPLVSCFFFFF